MVSHMFITQERSHGWSASRRNRNDRHGKNCAENTLEDWFLFAIFARNQNFRRKLRTSPKAQDCNAGGPQSHNKQGKAEGDDGRMQLLGISLISRKGDFWTSLENSKPHRDERNKDERKLDQPVNKSIDPLAWIIILPCHIEITRRAALHGKRSQRRNKNSKVPKLRSVKQSSNSLDYETFISAGKNDRLLLRNNIHFLGQQKLA